MSDTPTWMIDGKPGAILALMAQAIKAMSAISSKRGADGNASTTAQDVFDTVRETLVRVGVILQVVCSDVEHNMNKSLYVTVMVAVRYCAPDGSFVLCACPGGATAPNRKSAQAAITAAVKSIHRHTFLMEIVEAGHEPRTRMSDELVEHGRYLQTLNTAEELRGANAHATGQALVPEDWGAASELWDARMAQLVNLEGMDKRAWQKARMQQVEADDNKKKAFARARSDKAPKGRALDIRETERLDEAPSKRRK